MKVMMVGSARESGGGVATVIRTLESLPVWKEFDCYWLGTQIQRNYIWKVWYALKSYFIALCIIWRYDIIHFHTVPDRICLIIQLPIFLLARIGRKKIIMHVHMGNQLAEHTKNGLFKWCLNRSDLVILLAKKWKALFDEKFSDVKVPTAVLYNPSTHVEKVDWGCKQKLIIMVGFLNDNKAPNVLLKAWDMIHEEYPEWRVAILGNGEVERFKRMAEDMGLQDSVQFTGYLVGKEKEKYFEEASIFCMCSYQEGFPMVVLEAWEHDICVVTTPVGGLPDVLEEGKNALTFDFGDARGLADQLIRLMDSESLRRQLADYSYNFVEEHFSAKEIDREQCRIYENLH